MMSDKSAKKYTYYSLYNLFFMSDMFFGVGSVLLISLVFCVVLCWVLFFYLRLVSCVTIIADVTGLSILHWLFAFL